MYPVPSYYFMKNEISTNLKFCIGRVCGFNNTKDVICGDDCRDDYERSILEMVGLYDLIIMYATHMLM